MHEPLPTEPAVAAAAAAAAAEPLPPLPPPSVNIKTQKPRSPKQIAASLANGKKSRSPKNPAGRLQCAAASSQFKHRQLAETVLIRGECRKTFINQAPRTLHRHLPTPHRTRA